MSKDKAPREFWLGPNYPDVMGHGHYYEWEPTTGDITKLNYIHVIEKSYADVLEKKLAKCVAAIQYVMANNDKIKGWDKLHDAFYGVKK